MNLRLDHLLDALRDRGPEILAAIDADPLLVKRHSGPLTLANASPALFTPTAEHHLFAKGIVYRRDPFELVSLPLVKIYNLGERSVSVADLAGLAAEGQSRLHFLRKFDGTLIQRFQHGGRAVFTTRGMIEGSAAVGPQDEDTPAYRTGFDFLGTARTVAARLYPVLTEPRPAFDGLSLVFEFLHPETRVITDYGARQDLVLLTIFDRAEWRYRTYAEVRAFAAEHGLTAVDEFAPPGATLPEQIDGLLAAIAGTDQEGAVIAIEHDRRVVYRVKVKGPDYLRALKLIVTCTYARTVELLDANPHLTSWAAVESHLRDLGRESVPEEVLGFYREHYDTHQKYLVDCDRLLAWAADTSAALKQEAVAAAGPGADPRALRKAFAALAVTRPLRALLFTGFDGELDVAAVRATVKTPAEAADAIARIG